MPFNGAWIGVALGLILLLAPQLLLRSANGQPLFGGRDDSQIMRMGRIAGIVLLVVFAAVLVATGL